MQGGSRNETKAALLPWDLCSGFRCGDPCDIRMSLRVYAVPCSCSADYMRVRMYAKIGGKMNMKVVIWKSPKALRGLLCRIFGIRE